MFKKSTIRAGILSMFLATVFSVKGIQRDLKAGDEHYYFVSFNLYASGNVEGQLPMVTIYGKLREQVSEVKDDLKLIYSFSPSHASYYAIEEAAIEVEESEIYEKEKQSHQANKAHNKEKEQRSDSDEPTPPAELKEHAGHDIAKQEKEQICITKTLKSKNVQDSGKLSIEEITIDARTHQIKEYKPGLFPIGLYLCSVLESSAETDLRSKPMDFSFSNVCDQSVRVVRKGVAGGVFGTGCILALPFIIPAAITKLAGDTVAELAAVYAGENDEEDKFVQGGRNLAAWGPWLILAVPVGIPHTIASIVYPKDSTELPDYTQGWYQKISNPRSMKVVTNSYYEPEKNLTLFCGSIKSIAASNTNEEFKEYYVWNACRKWMGTRSRRGGTYCLDKTHERVLLNSFSLMFPDLISDFNLEALFGEDINLNDKEFTKKSQEYNSKSSFPKYNILDIRRFEDEESLNKALEEESIRPYNVSSILNKEEETIPYGENSHSIPLELIQHNEEGEGKDTEELEGFILL